MTLDFNNTKKEIQVEFIKGVSMKKQIEIRIINVHSTLLSALKTILPMPKPIDIVTFGA